MSTIIAKPQTISSVHKIFYGVRLQARKFMSSFHTRTHISLQVTAHYYAYIMALRIRRSIMNTVSLQYQALDLTLYFKLSSARDMTNFNVKFACCSIIL
jgi:hypothetical protein